MACTKSGLIDAGDCFQHPTLNPKQQQMWLTFFLAQFLTQLGGTDYSVTMSTTLISDSNSVFCGTSPDARRAMLLAIAQEISGNADSNEGIAIFTQCLNGASMDQIEIAQLYLLCAIKDRIISP